MTVDREQVPRDAAVKLPGNVAVFKAWALALGDSLAEWPLTREEGAWLLAELEQAEQAAKRYADDAVTNYERAQQAERERDEARKWANTMEHERDWETQVVHSELLQRAEDAEARLAAVPALVEALRQIAAYEDDCIHRRMAREALAAYQEASE